MRASLKGQRNAPDHKEGRVYRQTEDHHFHILGSAEYDAADSKEEESCVQGKFAADVVRSRSLQRLRYNYAK